jgi:hypothetical protein
LIEDETSASLAIGVNIDISKRGALNIEFIRYPDKGNLDPAVARVGATFGF